MHHYGDLPVIVAAPIGLLLVGYLALYPSAWALLVRAAVRRHGVGAVWLSPLFWVTTEWIRGSIGGGFPWVLLGSSQASVVPVVQFASIAGVYGLSALLALVSTAAAMLSLTRRPIHRAGVAAVAALIVIVTVAGAYRVSDGRLLREGRPLRVGLVQGNVPQDQKYDRRFHDDILGRYLDLSRQALANGASVVLWPEASTPGYFNFDGPMSAPIRRLALETQTPFVLGTDDYEPPRAGHPEHFYNAAVLVGPDGLSHQTYRKMQLVPFGEYVPMKSVLFFVGPLIQAVSDFSPGRDPVVFDLGRGRLSVAICYESVYPSLARTFVDHGSELLATITNDAWFGTSSAAYQHFAQGALRAVEEGRYVVRAANTGISGAVDPYGHVLAETPLFQPAAVAVDVRLLDDRTIYNRLGDLVVWFSLAATAAALVTLKRSRT